MTRKIKKEGISDNPENGSTRSLRDRAPKPLGAVARHMLRAPGRIAKRVQLHAATKEHEHNERKFQREQLRLDAEINPGSDMISELNMTLQRALQDPKTNEAHIRALISKISNEAGMGGIAYMGDTIIAAAQAPEGLSGSVQEAVARAINENWEMIKNRDPLLANLDLTDGRVREPMIHPEYLASMAPQRIRELVARGAISGEIMDIATTPTMLARMNMDQIAALRSGSADHTQVQ